MDAWHSSRIQTERGWIGIGGRMKDLFSTSDRIYFLEHTYSKCSKEKVQSDLKKNRVPN